MFEQALEGLGKINQLEVLIPVSILAVMLVSISKSGFGGGFKDDFFGGGRMDIFKHADKMMEDMHRGFDSDIGGSGL